MFVMVGDEVTVENLLKGIIIASGNDACVALAEGIACSEEEFAIMMTSKAKEIGIKMGEPYFKVKELVKKNDVYIFSSN